MAKKVRFVIEGEIVEVYPEGMTGVKIHTGIGDPVVKFASNTIIRLPEEKKGT